MKKKTILLLTVIFGFTAMVQSQIIISLIGEGAPGNDASWNTDTDLIDLGGGLYELSNAQMYDAQFKFRQDHDWTTAWGTATQPGFPTGTGDTIPGGPNIVATAGTYDVTFNLNTAEYNFVETLSITDLESVGFYYYPNPVVDILRMNANTNIDTVIFFNILGEKVLQFTPNSLESSVDISKLAFGTYFVQAQVGDSKGVFKIIKK